jgi:hypothetical protein
MRHIGTNATSMTAGAFVPTRTTIRPRLAARLYAGAVDAMPMTSPDPGPGRRT